jgi:hypothetical protein
VWSRTPSSPPPGVFSHLRFAVVARLRPEEAREFLVDFAVAGFVERSGSGWRLTPEGRAISTTLATGIWPEEADYRCEPELRAPRRAA